VQPSLRPAPGGRCRSTRVLLVAAVCACLVAAIALGAPSRLTHAWHSFKQPPTAALSHDTISRFGSLSGNGRYAYWKAAIDAMPGHWLEGYGPGTFEFVWLPRAPFLSYVRNAHSLYIEVMDELGLVGIVLLALALGYAEVLGAQDLYLGVNAVDYSGYPDCRPAFVRAFESLANLATAAAVEGRARYAVHAPLLELSKAEIIRRGTESCLVTGSAVSRDAPGSHLSGGVAPVQAERPPPAATPRPPSCCPRIAGTIWRGPTGQLSSRRHGSAGSQRAGSRGTPSGRESSAWPGTACKSSRRSSARHSSPPSLR